MSALLVARALVKEYPKVRAVDGVSFEVPAGICFGLASAQNVYLCFGDIFQDSHVRKQVELLEDHPDLGPSGA